MRKMDGTVRQLYMPHRISRLILLFTACRFLVVHFLMNHSLVSVEVTDSDERTTLHAACNARFFEMVFYFVKRCHANVEARVENGRTPLHVVLDSLTVLDDVNKLARFLRRNCRVDVEATGSHR